MPKRKQKEMENDKKRRRLIVYSSSSESEENIDNGSVLKEIDIHASTNEKSEKQLPNEQLLTTLDPDLLAALGDTSDDQPAYGEEIHASLAECWLPILKKGLAKEIKEKLLKDYTIPSNCKLLRAPTLNPEINAAVQDMVRNRDKNIQTKQDQLGLGLSAINKAMSVLLTSDDKLKAIKCLSDSCRILSDLHYVETQVRTKLITPCLENSFLPIIQDLDRDETLFSSNLPEKIKSSKAITKQGSLIKKTISNKTLSSPSPVYKTRNQRNWPSSPRPSLSSRGGRGGLNLRSPEYYWRTTTTQPTPYRPRTSSPLSQNKSRAPTRQ